MLLNRYKLLNKFVHNCNGLLFHFNMNMFRNYWNRIVLYNKGNVQNNGYKNLFE